MSRHTYNRLLHRRPATEALFNPTLSKKRPLPHLCPGNTHVFRFLDRVQLGLVDVSLGGYPLASYVACTQCVACVEFLGICQVANGKTQINSAWLLLPDGRGWELALPAQRTILIPHG